jgi:hypothetical protein
VPEGVVDALKRRIRIAAFRLPSVLSIGVLSIG